MSTPAQRTVSHGNYDSLPVPPQRSLESKKEEEGPLENLDDIRGYRGMVSIMEFTMSSPETPSTGHVDIPLDNNLVTVDGELKKDTSYLDDGVDDEMDSVNIESEAELFADILDHGAEVERSP